MSDYFNYSNNKLWPLRTNGCALPDDYEHLSYETLVLDLPFHEFHTQPTTFGEFEHSIDAAAMRQMIFQLMIVSARNLVDTSLAGGGRNLQNERHPIDIFVETVLSPEDELDEDDEQLAHVKRVLSDSYDDKDLFRDTNGEMRALLRDPRLRNMRFMHKLDHRKVYGVRIFICANDPSVRVSSAISDKLATIFNRTMELQRQDTLQSENREHQALMRRHNGDAEAANDITRNTGDLERFWRIESLQKWCTIAGVVLNDASLVESMFNNRRHEVLNAHRPYSNETNAINPRNVFCPRKLFQREQKNERIDAPQRRWNNYLRAQDSLRFPVASLVIQVDSGFQSLKEFSRMYLPHYQKRCIEPQLTSLQYRMPRQEIDVDEPPAPLPPRRQQQAAPTVNLPSASESIDEFDALNRFEDDSSSSSSEEDEDQRQINAMDSIIDLRVANRPSFDIDNDDDDNALVGDDSLVDENLPANHDADREAQKEVIEHVVRQMDITDPSQKQIKEKIAETGIMGRIYETHRLRIRFREHIKRQRQIKNRKKRARELVNAKLAALMAYNNFCTSAFSDVTGEHRKMNVWMQQERERGTLRFQRSFKFIDPRLSFFGNAIVRWYNDLDDVLDTCTAHAEGHLVLISSLNAYQYNNGLHLNILTSGPPGVSKSFSYELIQNMAIPGTVRTLTTTSDRAWDTDDSFNDQIVIFHEVPAELISGGSADLSKGTKGGNRSSQVDSMKEWMSTGLSVRRVLGIDQNGKRQARDVVSEKNLVLLMASNIKETVVDDAIRDRTVYIAQAPKARFDDVTMSDKQSSSNASDEEKQRIMEIMRHDYRLLQGIANHTEKLIKIGAIDDVTCDAFAVIWKRYTQTLQKEFGIRLPPRAAKKARLLVREHVIWNAIQWLYQAPTSPVFDREFHVYDLLLLEPQLKDSSEIVYFVLDLLRSQFFDGMRSVVGRALRKTVVPRHLQEARDTIARKVVSKPPQRIRNVQSDDADQSVDDAESLIETKYLSVFHDPQHEADLARNYKNRFESGVHGQTPLRLTFHERAKQADAHSGAHAQALAVDDDSNAPKCDFNYFVFKGSLSKLATEISNATGKLPEYATNLNKKDIEQQLKKFIGMTVESLPYEPNPDVDERRHTPVVPISNAQISKKRSYALLKVHEGNKAVSIHSSFLFGNVRDPHEVALHSCWNMHTPQSIYVGGRPARDDMPYLLMTRHAKPSRGVHLFPTNGSVSKTTKAIHGRLISSDGADKNGVRVLMESIDDYSTRMRLKVLSLPKSRRAFFRPLVDAKRIVADEQNLIAYPIDYPDTWIAEADERRRRRAIDIHVLPTVTPADIAHRIKIGELVNPLANDDDDDDEDDDDDDDDMDEDDNNSVFAAANAFAAQLKEEQSQAFVELGGASNLARDKTLSEHLPDTYRKFNHRAAIERSLAEKTGQQRGKRKLDADRELHDQWKRFVVQTQAAKRNRSIPAEPTEIVTNVGLRPLIKQNAVDSDEDMNNVAARPQEEVDEIAELRQLGEEFTTVFDDDSIE